MDIKLKFQHIRNRILSKLALQHKILLLFVGATNIILLFTVFFIGSRARKNSLKDAHAQIGITTDKYAESIKSLLEKDLSITRTISNAIVNHKLLPKERQFDIYTSIYKDVLGSNPDVLAVWDSWELKYLDSTYQKDFGRYKTTVWREDRKSVV